MNLGGAYLGRFGRRLLAALVLACAAFPAAVGAAPAPSAELSPRLTELSTPGLSSAPAAEQAQALDLAPSGAGSLLREGNRILAYVRFESGAPVGLAALRAAGAEIVSSSARYQTVTVAVGPADLPAIGQIAGVAGVTEALAPVSRAADCGGAARSEGDVQLNAAKAREDFGVDGSGVTVGILSDSFDRDVSAPTHAAGDVASGDLPGSGSPCGSTTAVGLLDDSSAGDDEGRAMAQIVHDLAPGAAIDFATAASGEFAFAANIRALAGAGAKVIVDDVAYFDEPFFQDGPVAVAVNEVNGGGVSYFSAAGNDNLISAGANVGSYEAPFRDAGSCPPSVTADGAGTHCMDFDPSPGSSDDAYELTVQPGSQVKLDLQWAEPWGGVATDLDVYLLGGSGEVLASAKERSIGNSQKPFELLYWKNEAATAATVQLAIPRFAGSAAPRLKFILVGNGAAPTASQYSLSKAGDVLGPAVFGHSGSTGAISVGAVRYNDASKPETFSSRGPVTHYFGPVGNAAPAAPIAPQTIAKPDLVASDGGANTFFGVFTGGIWRFFGSSAAAPHAVAVAALVRQANPGASAAQVRADLLETARPVGSFGPNDVGAGLVDAYQAVKSLALPPTISVAKGPEPLSRNRRPTIQFSANRPVVFSCEIDGGRPQICASPFTLPIPLGDGEHGIVVSGVDRAGRTGYSNLLSFEVDTHAPRTMIAKHPRKLIRTHGRKVRASFRFRSNEPGVIYVCKIDRGLLRFCGPKLSRRFAAGKHVVKVRGRDAAGNVDRTPAVFRFRVETIGRG